MGDGVNEYMHGSMGDTSTVVHQSHPQQHHPLPPFDLFRAVSTNSLIGPNNVFDNFADHMTGPYLDSARLDLDGSQLTSLDARAPEEPSASSFHDLNFSYGSLDTNYALNGDATYQESIGASMGCSSPYTSQSQTFDLYQAVSSNSAIGTDDVPEPQPSNRHVSAPGSGHGQGASHSILDLDDLIVRHISGTTNTEQGASIRDITKWQENVNMGSIETYQLHTPPSITRKINDDGEAMENKRRAKQKQSSSKIYGRETGVQMTKEQITVYLGSSQEVDTYLITCKLCRLEFTSVEQYLQHCMGAHGALICHDCGKSFTAKHLILRHRSIHTGLHHFACSSCKKTFARRDHCNRHIRKEHSSEASVLKLADATT